MSKGRKNLNQEKSHRIKYRFIVPAITLLATMVPFYHKPTHALGCPDIRVIFARGSGGERYTNADYLAFKSALEDKLATTDLTYEFDDLDYPAVSIDVFSGHLGTLLGAYVGGGKAYDFGDSVRAGTNEFLRVFNNDTCKETKYILGGYSQGALAILDGLPEIDPNRVLYIATFGDPKIYLPEGAGFVPPACSGRFLSDYRIYVPDCRAHKGIMGARDPYVIDKFEGKIGTWCNKFDVLCSSHLGIQSHTSYVEDGLYEDAARFIMSKVGAWYNIKNRYTSPHDTAILIDSTGSMESLIDQYKSEAMHLAQETLEAGGRVALYDYRDLIEAYTPVERCNFDTCDLATFQAGLEEIEVDGGGDAPESLLSASFHVMKRLNWNLGSTKSLVILTDNDYHSPDLDEITFYDVEKLSKQIDPVNFYVITTKEMAPSYNLLTSVTDGAVVSSASDLSLLTELISERFDSLPRVEEEFPDETYDNKFPEVTIHNLEDNGDSVKINFENSGETTVVILNDGILGETTEQEITITDLERDIDNTISLVPLSATRRGESVSANLAATHEEGDTDNGYGMVTTFNAVNEQGTNEITDTSGKDELMTNSNDDTELVGDIEVVAEAGNTQTNDYEAAQPENNRKSILSRIPDIPTVLVPKVPNTGRQ